MFFKQGEYEGELFNEGRNVAFVILRHNDLVYDCRMTIWAALETIRLWLGVATLARCIV
jgi:hypothetical protein